MCLLTCIDQHNARIPLHSCNLCTHAHLQLAYMHRCITPAEPIHLQSPAKQRQQTLCSSGPSLLSPHASHFSTWPMRATTCMLFGRLAAATSDSGTMRFGAAANALLAAAVPEPAGALDAREAATELGACSLSGGALRPPRPPRPPRPREAADIVAEAWGGLAARPSRI